MKPARVAQRSARHGVRGLSLIELMVGMALALLAIVAIYQVLSVWDARKRTITSGSSAQISGGIGIFELERDLQLSGGGFGNVSAATIGCTVSAYNSTFAIFTAKNVLGWRDKVEQEITGKDGAPLAGIQVMFVNPDGTDRDTEH